MNEEKTSLFSELTDSIKAKLYDFHYSPFMSSFVVSWIVLNHKYLLILLDDENIKLKLDLLNNYFFGIDALGYNIFYVNGFYLPLLMALFYVFVYPKFAKFFYEVTLKNQLNLREAKQKIEKTTLMTKEEKDVLIEEMIKIKEAYNKSREAYVTLEQKYKKAREKEHQNITNAANEVKIKIEEQLKYINQLEEKVTKLTEENDKLQITLQEGNSKIEQVNLDIGKDDKMSILKYLFDSNYSGNLYQSDLITGIVNATKIPRAVVESYILEFKSEGILNDNSMRRVNITSNGRKQLIELFYKTVE